MSFPPGYPFWHGPRYVVGVARGASGQDRLMVMFVMSKGRGARSLRQAALLGGVLVLLAGCDTISHYDSVTAPFDQPIDWWHQLQGGVIADERPPPPGIGDPYPNLGTIPPKPTPTDAATRRALTARLASERDRTDRLAAQDPIPAPGTPGGPPAPAAPAATPASAKTAPTPASTAAAPAPAPEAPPPMARIDAADAPPPPPTPPPPPAPPAPAALQAAASPTAPARGKPGPNNGEPAPSGPVPALPAAPPGLPVLAGIPPATTEPATPKPAPQVVAAFVPGSAVLRPESNDALRALAARRASGPVAVLGGGEARSNAPDAQAAALPLAWRRARAIEDVLAAAGVPASAMHVDAAALARGGVARLVD